MKTYILKKDLPDVKAGTELKLSDNAGTVYRLMDKCPFNDMYAFPREYVENNTEWFKLKEIELPDGLFIDVSGGVKEEMDELIRLWVKYKPKVIKGNPKYTLDEMKKSWDASRGIGTFYETFGSFITALNLSQ